jgi:DNA primase
MKYDKEQIKKVAITGYLQSLGLTPARRYSSEIAYHSPLTEKDKTPSFFVNEKKNTFYDYSSGEKGDVIRLYCLMNNLTGKDSFTTACENLKNMKFSYYFEADEYIKKSKQNFPENYEITEVRSLSNSKLIEYLGVRGISLKNAANFVKELHYTINHRNYFALGFPNNSGGYEVRSKYFQGSFSPKDISYYDFGFNAKVAVFEGFFDLLSYCEHYPNGLQNKDIIVLNSLSLIQKAIDLIHFYEFSEVVLYLDNDTAGDKATEKLKGTFFDSVNDQRYLYADYKDFNEFQMSKYTK